MTFEPACRNNWHIHHATSGGGQLLLCTAGEGWYQEEGKDAVSLHEGSVIMIPANVKHWHGAKKDSWFSHIAVEIPGKNCRNEWCEPVSDEEYNKRHRYARRTVYGVGSWNSDLKSKYGADFDLRRLQTMAAEQDHKCAICGQPETEMRNGIVRHLAVDHDHVTGKVRQLLCQRCNKGIGTFNDDIELIFKAIEYLKKHRNPA